MDITADDCRELLTYLQSRVRGIGWEGLDEAEAPTILRPSHSRQDLYVLIHYIHGIRRGIVMRSATGVARAQGMVNDLLRGEQVMQVQLEVDSDYSLPLVDLLPQEENVSAFARQLEVLERRLEQARFVAQDRGVEPEGPELS